MYVVCFPVELDQLAPHRPADTAHDRLHVGQRPVVEHATTVLRHEDQVNLKIVNTAAAVPEIIIFTHRPRV